MMPDMPHPLLRPSLPFSALLLVVLLGLTSGCLTTIDGGCEEIAASHCALCFSCGEQVEGLGGAALCNLPPSAASSRGACESALRAQCADQANAIQDPFDDLEACQDALDKDRCAAMVERYALDQPDPPLLCRRFI